ncbi:MAG TPA: ABC transporter permease [Streptosporangiaceae bacterium]|jgi:peptide/nickel transport system permease protein|nr:ABC transporter permease [Streptosporangiaceae bacterium]
MTSTDVLDPSAPQQLPGVPGSGRRSLRDALRDFGRNYMGLIGLSAILFMLLFSFVGPLLYPTNQVQPNLLQVTRHPSGQFPLGTDQVGYNVLGRLMVAGQSSLEVGLAAAAIATVVGTLWGAVAGFAGGWLDSVMMRIVDALLAIPALLMVLLLTTILTPSIIMVIFVLGLISWLVTARLVRGQVLVLKQLEYVQAAQQFGERAWQIVAKHLVRNVIGTVVVQATFEVANAILLFATLSFLGLGPPPPAVNWGGMLNDGLNYVFDGYWWLIYPAGLCIVITVVAFNMIGDAIRNSLEVRLTRR